MHSSLAESVAMLCLPKAVVPRSAESLGDCRPVISVALHNHDFTEVSAEAEQPAAAWRARHVRGASLWAARSEAAARADRVAFSRDAKPSLWPPFAPLPSRSIPCNTPTDCGAASRHSD